MCASRIGDGRQSRGLPTVLCGDRETLKGNHGGPDLRRRQRGSRYVPVRPVDKRGSFRRRLRPRTDPRPTGLDESDTIRPPRPRSFPLTVCAVLLFPPSHRAFVSVPVSALSSSDPLRHVETEVRKTGSDTGRVDQRESRTPWRAWDLHLSSET